MRSKFNLILVLWFFGHCLVAFQQETGKDTVHLSHVLTLRQSGVVSSKKALPYWLLSNNSYRLRSGNYVGLWTDISLEKAYNEESGKLDYFYGLEGSGFAGSKTNFSLIQAYGGISTRRASLRFGTKEEFFGLNDSTLSIGNLFYGNNARPIPKIVLSTNGWVKPPFLSSFIRLKLYLAHGWFEKGRFQSKALLHQKYLYVQLFFLNNRLQLTGGLNHSAQWGGHNDVRGTEQPTSLKDYARILIGYSGGSEADEDDQLNALGNHLGTYDLRASLKLSKFTLSNYWQFLWEDKSGLTPFNWRDGIMGVSVKSNSRAGLVQGFNLEIIRTNSQDAIKYDDQGNQFLEPDHFFNNSVYQSGWTYQGRVIANPVFIIPDSKRAGGNLIKNRVNAVNFGIEGAIKKLFYQVNFRHFKNQGTFLDQINPPLKLSSLQLSVTKILRNSTLSAHGVYEWGSYPGDNFGIIFTYMRTFSLSDIWRKRQERRN